MAALTASPASARPLTPFPHTHHTHVLTHGHTASYFHYTPEPYVHASQPLHFHMRAMPIHTPPSLLHRRSSGKSASSPSASASSAGSGSAEEATPSAVAGSSRPVKYARTTSSDYGLPAMPELLHPIPRRVSTASTSESSSPPMPTTPILGSPTAAPPTPLALPPPAYPKRSAAFLASAPPEQDQEQEQGRSPLSSFRYDPFSTSTSDGYEVASIYHHASGGSGASPKRPALKRRDTPRPQTTTLSSLGMSVVRTHGEEEDRKVFRSVIDGGRWVIVG